MEKVRVRIAPSPTGNLHLGTAHTALFNFAFARHYLGDFILRIDDSDQERSKKIYETDIINSLKLLGIHWDEGPDIGGPARIYRQSERGEIYQYYLHKLIKEKKAYYCYCTKEELEEEKKQLVKKGLPFKYGGKCRNLSLSEKEKFVSNGRKPAIRLINPNKKVAFVDLIRGEITVDSTSFGDFIIARSDGSPLLVFATTIDDIEMKISHALRGEDFLNLVPRQLLLFEALKTSPPYFAHFSFLYATDKTKLSKRHGATSISEYKALGYLKDALINYLGSLGYSLKNNRDIFNLQEFIEDFDIGRVTKGAPIFNIDKLDWYNGYYIRQTPDAQLATQIYHFLNRKYPQDLILKTVPIIKERIKKLSDYLLMCQFFFSKPEKYEIDLSKKGSLFSAIWQILKEINDWQGKVLGERMQKLAKNLKIDNSEFFMLVRVAITGCKISPPLNESLEILGKEEVLSRIKKLC